MGPRLCRRGNEQPHREFCQEIQLQWGHVFVDVEMPGASGGICGPGQASMGPRLCRRGNEQPHREFCQEIQLQWGHVFVDVEIVHLLSARGKQPGFNGATSL